MPKLMKNLIKCTKKKQMVLELEVNVIGTSTEKNLQIFVKFKNISCSLRSIRNILIGNIDVNNQKDINNNLYLYYKNLFNERQHPYAALSCIVHSFGKEELGTSQRQATINLIQKKRQR